MLSERAHIWHGDQHLGADGTRKRAILGEGDATERGKLMRLRSRRVAARLLHHPGVVAERVERGEETIAASRLCGKASVVKMGWWRAIVCLAPRSTIARRPRHRGEQSQPLVVPRPAAAEHLVQRVDLEGLRTLGLATRLITPFVSCSFFWSSTTAAPRLAHPGVEPRPPRIACTLRGNTPEATLRCMCSTFETNGSTACIVRSGARTA